MIHTAKSGSTAKKGLILPVNLSLRLTGAFYAVYGGLAAAKLLQLSPPNHGLNINHCASLILIGFALFGLALCLSIENLLFDPSTRTYEYRKGLWPFIKPQSGPISDIRAIVVDRVACADTEAEAPQSSPHRLRVQIEWTDARTPLQLLSSPEESLFRGSSRRKILADAARIANSMGVSICDCSVPAKS